MCATPLWSIKSSFSHPSFLLLPLTLSFPFFPSFPISLPTPLPVQVCSVYVWFWWGRESDHFAVCPWISPEVHQLLAEGKLMSITCHNVVQAAFRWSRLSCAQTLLSPRFKCNSDVLYVVCSYYFDFLIPVGLGTWLYGFWRFMILPFILLPQDHRTCPICRVEVQV